ncbi:MULTISPECIES: hypothetical protein [Mesoflavibacter]
MAKQDKNQENMVPNAVDASSKIDAIKELIFEEICKLTIVSLKL